MNITLPQFEQFILIFIRILAIVGLVPTLGHTSVPAKVKIGLAALLSLIIFPVAYSSQVPQATDIMSLMIMISKEAAIGVIIGFATTLLFSAVQIAGGIIGMQMGFGIVNVIDPQSGSQISIIAELKALFAILIFLLIDGHHFLIDAIAYRSP